MVDISRGWKGYELAEVGVLLLGIEGAWGREDGVGDDGISKSIAFAEGKVEVAGLRVGNERNGGEFDGVEGDKRIGHGFEGRTECFLVKAGGFGARRNHFAEGDGG